MSSSTEPTTRWGCPRCPERASVLGTGTGSTPRCPGIPNLVAGRADPYPALPSPPATAIECNKTVEKHPCAVSLWEGLARPPRRCCHVPGHRHQWVGRWGGTRCPHPDDALGPANNTGACVDLGLEVPTATKSFHAAGGRAVPPTGHPGRLFWAAGAPHPQLGHASTQPRVKMGGPGPLLSVPKIPRGTP